jgi:hypothetical protein
MQAAANLEAVMRVILRTVLMVHSGIRIKTIAASPCGDDFTSANRNHEIRMVAGSTRVQGVCNGGEGIRE